MNNEHNNDSDNNTRSHPYSHSFNFGTTIQNVLRNINQAFTNNHESGGGGNDEQDRTDDIPPLEPLNSTDGRLDSRPSDIPASSSSVPLDPSTSSASQSVDTLLPPSSQSDSQRDDDDGDSMPELRSVSDSSDDSDAGLATLNPQPSHQDSQPVDDDHNSEWTDDERDSPRESVAGTRRARVDDDGDDARDRRHPSERVGGPLASDLPPQNANPQQPPRVPVGLFDALFGIGPPGGNPPGGAGGDAPPEHVHTGEAIADSSPADSNAIPGHTRRGAPILIAGFTLTIPFFGPAGNGAGPGPGGQPGQGGPAGMSAMDAATREELFASFAAFFQEFQALEEGREDPERAKKLVSGLEVVPLGLVKRLERVGGAPGGHAGDSSTEGSSGCAICWDTLLDAENDGFQAQQPPGSDASQSASSSTVAVDGHAIPHTDHGAMDVDASSAAASHPEPSASVVSSSATLQIISLPCAHVFHATCLLPWFTRAKQATCPTCRFNIDPENLTYAPPPRRAFTRAPAQPGNAAPNTAPGDPQGAPGVPPEAPAMGPPDAAVPQVDATRATAGPRPEPAGAMPRGPPPPPPTGQAGVPPVGLGFSPFPLPTGQAGVPPMGLGFNPFAPPTGQAGVPPIRPGLNPFAPPAPSGFNPFVVPPGQAGAPPAGGFTPFAAPAGQAGTPPAGLGFNPFAPPFAQQGVPPAGPGFNPFVSPTGQAGTPPSGQGFAPFGPIPILSFPAIQIPLRPPGGQAGDGNQGDVLTIGLDMFLGGAVSEDRGEPRDNADAANGGPGVGAAGENGAANPNGFTQDLQALIDGLIRTTRNIIPQMMNAQGQGQGQGPAPAPAADAPPAEGVQPQSQPRQAPEADDPQPVPPPPGARFVPFPPFRPNMFRPTRPMPPRRERKTWTLPAAPGPSLRQHVERREREQGLRCSDTSCGVGPSDDEPCPDPSASTTKQISIHSLAAPTESVCTHSFHPACLVSAERVAGWGGEDKTEPLVEVSCPACRAVGWVTRDEWESGVSALTSMDLCC